VIVRREPVVIQAVTLVQLRQELRRARLAEAGYERQIAQQYQTIRRLQAQLDTHLRELREANAQRATQLDGQYNVILQAFGLVIFAIIGALLLALSRSHSRPEGGSDVLLSTPPVVDWDPLQRQLREAKSALATVEARLRRLETSVDPLATNQ
jgi:type II secretory pathway component PulM